MNLNDLSYLQSEIKERSHFFVDATFPPRSHTYQHLIEYRIKLMAENPIALYGGESMLVKTNCIIKKNANVNLYIKRNPDVCVQCEERFVKCEDQSLSVKVFNTSNHLIKIPKDICIAYLIVSI